MLVRNSFRKHGTHQVILSTKYRGGRFNMFNKFLNDLGDQELSKGYKFIKRVLSNFAANNGIRLNVDDETGVQIEEIEEEGIFKIRFRFDSFL